MRLSARVPTLTLTPSECLVRAAVFGSRAGLKCQAAHCPTERPQAALLLLYVALVAVRREQANGQSYVYVIFCLLNMGGGLVD